MRLSKYRHVIRATENSFTNRLSTRSNLTLLWVEMRLTTTEAKTEMERVHLRKICSLISIIALMSSGIWIHPVQANNSPSNGRYGCNTGLRSASWPNFTITNRVVSDGVGCSGVVIIPTGVTTIGSDAFSGATGLVSIKIPPTVTTIGDYAFFRAKSLVSFKIPPSVTTIGANVFREMDSLKSIVVDSTNKKYSSQDGVLFTKSASTLIQYPAAKTGKSYIIPDGVTNVGDFAFEGASNLVSIEIPATVTDIGYHPFTQMHSLRSIVVDSSNKNYSSQDGVLFTKSASTLIQYPAAKTGKSFTIPAGVIMIYESAFKSASSLATFKITADSKLNSIGPRAFEGATGLVSIDIPATVTSIGSYAFSGATSLVSVNIPTDSKLTSIGSDAFSGATSLVSIDIPAGVTTLDGTFAGAKSLKSINIPVSVTTIGYFAFKGATSLASVNISAGSKLTTIEGYAFYGATSLKSINIPGGVTTIGDGAFFEAKSLRTINIPAGVTTIGDSAFARTDDLVSIKIPATVTTIGYAAFAQMDSLRSIVVDSSNTNYSSQDGVLFNKPGTTLIKHPAAKTGSTYIIPNGVINIGGYAFDRESSLVSIEIPATVTTIGGMAFQVHALESITIPAAVTTIGADAFANAMSLKSVIFLGNAPRNIDSMAFYNIGPSPKAFITSSASGFGVVGSSWRGLTVTPFRQAYATAKPIVTGAAKVSETLTALKGAWSGSPTPTFTYRWYACTKAVANATAKVPSICNLISNATKATLKLGSSQKGTYVSVLVTAQNATKWLSKSTGKVN